MARMNRSALGFVFAFILLSCGLAEAKSYEIRSIDSNISIQPDGSILVSEAHVLAFSGSFSYYARDMPAGDFDGISDISVWVDGKQFTEGDGVGHFTAESSRGTVTITPRFEAADRSVTFVFRYKAEGVLTPYSDIDELFWKAIPPDRDVDVGSGTARVTYPADVDPSATEIGFYTDGKGARQYFVGNRTAVFTATGIPPGDSFAVRCAMPKGMVSIPFSMNRYLNSVAPLAAVFAFIAMLLACAVLYYSKGRDAPIPRGGYASRVSSPPDSIEPGLVGVLMDEQADDRDVMATLLDLARRGYVTVAETKAKGPLFGKAEATFSLVRERDAGLKRFERDVLDVFFKNGDEVSTKSLSAQTSLPERVKKAKGSLYAETVARGLFPESPEASRLRHAVLAFILIIAGFIGWVALDGSGMARVASYACAGVMLGSVPLLVISRFMPRRTSLGAEEKKKWDAFRRYLGDLSSFRSTPEGAPLFEKHLPYAVVFGVERGFILSYDRMGAPPPIWFIPIHPHVPGSGLPGGQGAAGASGGALPSLSSSLGSLQGATDSFYGALNAATTAANSSRGGGFGGSHGSFGGGGGFGGGGAHAG